MSVRRAAQEPKNRGAELLASWRGDKSPLDACLALGINEAALHAFLGSRATPGLKRAKRIEEATAGYVPATSWLDPPKSKNGKQRRAA